MKSEKEAKSILKMIFLVLFLDLVGFSIIFPMFPSLAKYYLEVDGQNFILVGIFKFIETILQESNVQNSYSPIVLFGGILGALYSLLQFFSSPFWGGLSDRIGRRGTLVWTLLGMTISYLIWIFSGSFTLLVIARLVGGLMGGNISVATAVVSDVTDEKTRSKGMALVGIAFALGFIIGPAMGGLLSLVDLTKVYPSLSAYGINPFSFAAFGAFLLSCLNLYLIHFKFKETLNPKNISSYKRTSNVLELFKPLPYKGVNLTNLGYFLFLFAFSGMEFTLTFLAVERLGFSSLNNGVMFIFIGLIMALVQGGFVRRKAAQIGEKKLVLMGMVIVIPGLLILSQTHSVATLYLGLAFLSVGSSMIIPCLTTLVSFYGPDNEQGRVLGVFRSLGALARVGGPLVAAVLYWKYGAATPYLYGSLFVIIPIILLSKLPKPASD